MASVFDLFESVAEKDKVAAIHTIIEQAAPNRDFFFMVTLSVAMASFGVLIDSVVVLIGSMLIAPILYPVLSLALGITTVDEKLVTQSGRTLLTTSLVAVGAGILIGVLFSAKDISQFGVIGDLAYSGPSLAYAVVAGISGFAAAFALVKPNLSSMLPGVAISVSLIPPLSIIGVAIASFNTVVAINAFLLYLVNIVGIVLCAMFVFVLLRLPSKQDVVERVVTQEQKEIKEEQERRST